MPTRLPTLKHLVLATLAILILGGPATLANPEDPLLAEALAFSKRLDPGTDVPASKKAFDELVEAIRGDLEEARKEHDGVLLPRPVVAILNRRILVERSVSYLSNVYWRDSLFTAALLGKSGNCVSTSLLYYLVGRRLKLPVRLAIAPGHMYVRYGDGDAGLDIETTAKGMVIDRARLLSNFELDERDTRECGFLRSLTEAEARANLYDVWAATLGQLDQDEAALELIEKALALWPNSRLLALSRAGQLLGMGRSDEAEETARKVLVGSQSPFFLTRGAMLYCQMYEEAREFDRAIHVARYAMRYARKRQISQLCDQLGSLYRHKREFERAIVYHQMTADLKYDADAFNSLGSALTEARRDREAIEAYETAVKLNPEDYFPKVILAGLYERVGDKQKGRSYFASIEKPRGRTLEWLNALVWYYAVIGDEQKMLESMGAALALDPSPSTWNYYEREPDLDPYRERPAFAALMKQHRPK